VGETPGKPGLQFQRGFFIVPAAPRFVNERALTFRPGSGRYSSLPGNRPVALPDWAA